MRFRQLTEEPPKGGFLILVGCAHSVHGCALKLSESEHGITCADPQPKDQMDEYEKCILSLTKLDLPF